MKFFNNTNALVKTANIALIVGLLIAVGFEACKKPLDNINLIVNSSSLSQSPTLITYGNANANGTTLPDNFKVTISGAGAQYVRTDGGGTDFTVSGGLLPLNLTKDAAPSVANPIVFSVYAAVPGFTPVVTTVTITNGDAHVKAVNLLEFAHLPDGSSTLSSNTSLTAGTSGVVKLSTPTNATLAENATLSIPAGTQMLDANGTLINASTLNTTLVQYGVSSPQMLANNPGSGHITNAVGADGKPIAGGLDLVNAGTLSINMTAGGTAVKSFSQPVQLTIELPVGMPNINTGNPVAAGETIPVWSMNESTGQWKAEGNATVALDANGKLAATTAISHLTDWSVASNLTFTDHVFDINFKPTNLPWRTGTYYLQFTTTKGNFSIYSTPYVPNIDFFEQTDFTTTQLIDTNKYGFHLTKVPVTKYQYTLELPMNNSSGVPYQTPAIDLTTATSVDIPVTTPLNIPTTITLSAKCTNKDVVVVPKMWLTVYNFYTHEKANIYYNGTSAKISLIDGSSYSISTTYNNSTYTTQFFIASKDRIDISQKSTGGNSMAGAYSFDATSKTATIAASITLQNCN